MSSNLFTKTPKLQQAVNLINNLDDSKFPLLLSRILQKCHLKDEESFSEEEEKKLENSLSMNADDLQLLLETISFIFEQAAYHLCKPQILKQNLEQIDVNEDKTEAIIQSWASNAKSVTERLRKRSMAPLQLSDLSWELRLQLAQSSISKMNQPLGTLQMELTSHTGKENLGFQFTQDQLFKFYNQLETIQSQLDALR